MSKWWQDFMRFFFIGEWQKITFSEYLHDYSINGDHRCKNCLIFSDREPGQKEWPSLPASRTSWTPGSPRWTTLLSRLPRVQQEQCMYNRSVSLSTTPLLTRESLSQSSSKNYIRKTKTIWVEMMSIEWAFIVSNSGSIIHT